MIRTPSKLSKQTKKWKPSRTPQKKRTAYKPVAVRIGRQPLPLQLFNTLRYCETVNIAISLGAQNTYQFTCNGLFRPNAVGAGHQPLYFDQLKELYNYNTVLRSRIRWQFILPTSIDYITTVATSIEDDTIVTVTNPAFVAERTGGQISVFNPLSTATGGTPINNVRYQSWDAKKTFGADPQSDPNLTGTALANPAELSYYTIVISDNSSQTYTFVVNVVIEYDVVWDELKSVVSS